MAYKLAIFDFDGTLADSADWFMGILNQIAERYRFRTVSDVEITMLRGRSNRDIVRYFGIAGWKMPFIANHMRKLMARDATQIALFPGVHDLLRALHERGVEIAIVTSNSEENVRCILGPESAAHVTYYACGASLFGKARKFRQVLKRSGVTRSEVICIGDETRDIEAAFKVGLASGAVTWGYATPSVLESHGPTWLFASLDEIVAAIAASSPASAAGCGPGSRR